MKIQKILKRYMIVGGYPEYFEIKDIEVWQKELSEDIIPIEVKYTNQIESSDLKVIKKFLDEHQTKGINQAKFGIVVTKDILKKEGNIYFVPYWLINI